MGLKVKITCCFYIFEYYSVFVEFYRQFTRQCVTECLAVMLDTLRTDNNTTNSGGTLVTRPLPHLNPRAAKRLTPVLSSQCLISALFDLVTVYHNISCDCYPICRYTFF